MSKFAQRHPNYEADWAGYRIELNDEMARVLIDLEAENLEEQDELPLSVCFTIPVRRYDERGETPAGAQARELVLQLCERIEAECLALHVGIITFAESFDVQYRFAPCEGLEAKLKALADEVLAPLGVSHTLSAEDDPEWNSYFSFSPDDWAMLQIENAQVFSALEEGGDVMTAVRPVQFCAIFDEETQAKVCMQTLETKGYNFVNLEHITEADEVDEDEDFEPYYMLLFERAMSLESLDDFNDSYIELSELVLDHNGDLDGWESELVSK